MIKKILQKSEIERIVLLKKRKMKKKKILLLTVAMICISLFVFKKTENWNVFNEIVSRVEALSQDPEEDLWNMTVTGMKTHYEEYTFNTGEYTIVIYFPEEILVGYYEVKNYNEFNCCGSGYDDCVIFAPDRQPYLCKHFEDGVRWWLGETSY